MQAHFDLNQISRDSRLPMDVSFIDALYARAIPCRFVIPVAISERRQLPLLLDGSLNEWDAADAVQVDQPLVRMFDRAGVSREQLQTASQPTSVFTTWSDDNFYVAFRLGGVDAASAQSPRMLRNFVEYRNRRAAGEDLCEVLVQPMFIDNSLGYATHIICKPDSMWIERKVGDDAGDAQSGNRSNPPGFALLPRSMPKPRSARRSLHSLAGAAGFESRKTKLAAIQFLAASGCDEPGFQLGWTDRLRPR